MGSWQDAYNTKGDMYQNGEYVGNIYLTSKSTNNISAPMHIFKTIYLWLTYSDDNGETWSNPVSISDQVKEDWMKFCGTGPGVGIEVQNGEYAGRLIFPIYYTEASGFQSSACVYSDDGGVTWKRGESPNDGRINSSGQATNSQNPSGISQLTESQIIELNNGHLLQFMRNYGGAGKVAVARSTDGGATWEDPYNTDATEVYCQLSVIHYPEALDVTGDGTKDEVIVMSNPGGSGRNR
jgi:Neuraminidase (sialidase)